MKFFMAFLRQKAPVSGKDTPQYYRRALSTNQVALAVYFLLTCLLLSWSKGSFVWVPAAMCAGMILCALSIGHVNCRGTVYFFELLIMFWCGWHTNAVGWNYGAQHLLIPMLTLCFFNIYDPSWVKVFTFLVAVAYRMILFTYSLDNSGSFEMSRMVVIIYQTLNSLTVFNLLAIDYILFSSSIQESERELIIHNQELHKEAGTDPLTNLPNRRAMVDEIDQYKKVFPEESFSVAIADIDFFKRVNDTYGHQCGDYTLETLAALFMEKAGDKYKVCRWGGEEFCFFLPGMNLDQAGRMMQELNVAVRKMSLHFGDVDFSITITIGLEENDFKSSLEEILDRADRKLYMGKVHGRDQVVI